MPWPIRFGPLPRMTTFGRGVRSRLALRVEGPVEIRRERLELGGAGVDALVGPARGRPRGAPRATSVSVDAGERGEVGVAEAAALERRPAGPARARRGRRAATAAAARRDARRTARGTTGRSSSARGDARGSSRGRSPRRGPTSAGRWAARAGPPARRHRRRARRARRPRASRPARVRATACP